MSQTLIIQLQQANYEYLFSDKNLHGARDYLAGATGLITEKPNPDRLIITTEEDYYTKDALAEIADWYSKKPYEGANKLLVIEYSDKLTSELQNSLLKVIEEPVDYSQIILLANNSNILLTTLLSRCQIIQSTLQEPHIPAIAEQFLNANFIERLKLTEEISKLPNPTSVIYAIIEQLLTKNPEKLQNNKSRVAQLAKLMRNYRLNPYNHRLTLEVLTIILEV